MKYLLVADIAKKWNSIIGGLIGGVVLIFKIIGIAGELISIVTGHFWTKSPKAEI